MKGNSRNELGPRAPSVSGIRRSAGSATLLLLEDAASVRRPLRLAAEDYGCSVLEAATVAEAESLWASREVTGLCVDLNLEDGSGPEGGLEFLERIRRSGAKEVPALLLTGRREKDLAIRPAQLRALYVHKPVELRHPYLSRFFQVTASWTDLMAQLEEIVVTHDSLNKLHFEVMRLYLYLGSEALPTALGLSPQGCYKRIKTLKDALQLRNLDLLWQYLRLDAPGTVLVQK